MHARPATAFPLNALVSLHDHGPACKGKSTSIRAESFAYGGLAAGTVKTLDMLPCLFGSLTEFS